MPDRLWSDADRELVAGLVRALPPPPSLPGAIGGLGPSPEEFADDVLDALTAAGWRPARDYLPAASEALDRHAARVREQVAEEIAQAIEEAKTEPGPPDGQCADKTAAIARAHRTTPTEEPDHA